MNGSGKGRHAVHRRCGRITRLGVVYASMCGILASTRVLAQRLPAPPVAAALQPPAVARPIARVIGEVFDSVAMQPLTGAIVQLVSAKDPSRIRSATTGTSGTFVVDSLAEGTYVLGFLHERLDTFGIESALHRVDIQATGEMEVRLAIPSAATIIAQRCGTAPVGQAPSMFIGAVRSASGPTLSAPARVRAQWTEVLVGRQGLERRTPARFIDASESGSFAFCGVPTDAPILTRAFAGSDSSGVVELSVPRNGLLVRNLYVGAAARVERAVPLIPSDRGVTVRVKQLSGSGQLRGAVRTTDGKPIVGARIGLWDGATDTTNADGQFTLHGLPTGTYTLESRALGFQLTRRPVDILENADAIGDVVMDVLAPVLDAVKVKARADASAVPLADFERRKKGGFGYFIDETQITKRAAMTTADLFRATPGMTVIAGVGRGDKVLMRNAGSGGSCVPAVYMNGVLVPTDGNLDEFIQPNDVRGIEIYARTASVPMEFQSRNGCGSIVLWTGARRTPPKP